MRDLFPAVKMLTGSSAHSLVAAARLEHLRMFLCKNGPKLISQSLSDDDSMACVPGFDSSQPTDYAENGH